MKMKENDEASEPSDDENETNDLQTISIYIITKRQIKVSLVILVSLLIYGINLSHTGYN